MVFAVIVPSSGSRPESRQKLQQKRFELVVGTVDLVDQQHRRFVAPDRSEQRAL